MGIFRVELKGVFSPELNDPEVPEDPSCCCIYMSADIGEAGREAADQFNFYVVTPRFLMEHPEVRWGRGYLLVPEFSWSVVERMLARLTSSVRAESWEGAVRELCKFVEWEFEGYDDRPS
jgi:hypothetical protein